MVSSLLLLTLAAAPQPAPLPALLSPSPLVSIQDRGGRGGAGKARGGAAGRGDGAEMGGAGSKDLRQWLQRTKRSINSSGKGRRYVGTGSSRSGSSNQFETPLVAPVQQLYDSEQLQSWHAACDLDDSGWVSFRESAVALDFDRPRFRRFDEDNDGAFSLDEFTTYQRFAALEGSFRPPSPRSREAPPRRTPEQLRNAYDLDSDGRLSSSEMTAALTDYGRTDLVPEQVFRDLDGDRNAGLDINELEGLVSVLLVVLLPEGEINSEAPAARSIDELFGTLTERSPGSSAPPHISGPVSPFRRLDLDGDGKLTAIELEELLRPLFTPIRVRTVLHTLDINQDGVLDESEYRRSLDASLR